jgi:hypothetical protein
MPEATSGLTSGLRLVICRGHGLDDIKHLFEQRLQARKVVFRLCVAHRHRTLVSTASVSRRWLSPFRLWAGVVHRGASLLQTDRHGHRVSP